MRGFPATLAVRFPVRHPGEKPGPIALQEKVSYLLHSPG